MKVFVKRDVKTVTQVVTQSVVLPSWVVLAVNGRKIEAIKELLEIAGFDPEGRRMALGMAKRMVESFSIVTDTTYE